MKVNKAGFNIEKNHKKMILSFHLKIINVCISCRITSSVNCVKFYQRFDLEMLNMQSTF